MKKRLSMLGIIGTSFAMAIAVGASLMHKGEVREAKAAEDPGDYTLTITYGSFGITDQSYKHRNWIAATTGGSTISGTGSVVTSNDNSYIQVNKSSSRAAAIYNTIEMPGKITKISAKWADTTYANKTFNGYLMNEAPTHGTGNGEYTRPDGAVLINEKPVTYGDTTDEVVLGTSTGNYKYFSFEENGTGASYFTEIKIYYTVEEVSGTLTGLEISKESVSGYLVGDTFTSTEFTAEGITVKAVYDSGDKVIVDDYEVTSTLLVSGDNNVKISYTKDETTVDAYLVVNAKTQAQYDAEAAALFDSHVDAIDTTATGFALVNSALDAQNEYNSLNENAKLLVTKLDALNTIIDGIEDKYVLFYNSIENDANAKILDESVVESERTPVPATWNLPSDIEMKIGSCAYNGAYSRLKLGTGSASGYATFALKDTSYIFTKVKVGATIYSSDSISVLVNGLDDYKIAPTANGAETVLIDISESRTSEITISTSTKRAYINYIYYETALNEDILGSTIAYTGDLVKDTYFEGQSFDPTGLTFSVSYNSGATSKEIAANSITWSPAVLTTETTAVTGTYIEGEQSATCSINVTVNAYTASYYGQVGQEIADYSGTYYFYNSDAQKVWDATRSSELYSSMDVTVTNNIITSTANLDACKVVLAKVDDGYTLANSNGDYIGPKGGSISTVVDAVTFEAANVHQLEKVDNDGTITLSATQMNGETPTKVYLRFNSNSGQLKARYYTSADAVKGLTMFLKDAVATKTNVQVVDEFVEGYMHTEIAYTNNADTNACRAEGEGAENYYALAKAAFNDLSEKQRALFVENDRYAQPYARLLAWATANHQAFDETNTLGARINTLKLDGESNSVILIIVLSSVAAISLGFVIALKKKKHN